MTNETTLTIGFVIAVIGCAIGIYGFFGNYKKSIKEDETSLSNINQSLLKLNMKIDQVCTTTNETRTDLKSMRNDIDKMRETQIKHQMEIDAIWRTLDNTKGS